MNTMNGESREKGATTILMAVALVGLIGAAALAIDLGYGLVVKSELQNVSDTSTLAGTRELAMVYNDLDTTDQAYWGTHTLTASERARIEAKINTFSQANKAGGVSISVNSSDLVYGKYTNGSFGPTTPAYTGVMGIRVTAKRDETANGVVNTWLGRVLGINTLSIKASSASSLSSLKKVPSGALGIPVGISKYWFTAKNSPCGKPGDPSHHVRLYPTGPQSGETNFDAVGCAGWHTYTEYPASAARLKSILNDLKSGDYTSPVTEANVTQYNFTGGAVATAFNNMKLLYNVKKNANGVWETVVPVYDAVDCSNPNGAITIVGFATAYIYSVNTSPSNTMDATITCNIVDWGEGGNNYDYGTLVGRPGMLE